MKRKLKTKKHMQPTHMSGANNYINKFNVFALVGNVEADILHPSTVYWSNVYFMY